MSADDDSPRGRLGYLLAASFALAVHALFAVLAIVGILIVAAMVGDWRAGEVEPAAAVFIGFLGGVMTLIGAGFFWLVFVGSPRWLGGVERERAKYRDRPWLVDRRWRARRVVHSTGSPWFMWFWCFLWWGIVGIFWSVNGELIMADLRGSWSEAVPVALPFVVGIVGLLAAIGVTWRRWRYGNAVLLIDTLPGYLGERFRGRVQARLANRPGEPVGVTLACVSRRRTRVSEGGSGRMRTVYIDDDVWSTSSRLNPTQTTFDRGLITLPISFELPAGLPESDHYLEEPQIVWKISVSPDSAADGLLKSVFEIPVFPRRDPT